MKSIEDMPVVFALYDDLFPVITMDFTNELVAALEWSGTFDGVEAGSVYIYKLEFGYFKWLKSTIFTSFSWKCVSVETKRVKLQFLRP